MSRTELLYNTLVSDDFFNFYTGKLVDHVENGKGREEIEREIKRHFAPLYVDQDAMPNDAPPAEETSAIDSCR